MNRLKKEGLYYCVFGSLVLFFAILHYLSNPFYLFAMMSYIICYALKERFLGKKENKDELENEILSKSSGLSLSIMFLMTFAAFLATSYLIEDRNQPLGMTFNQLAALFFALIGLGILIRAISISILTGHYYNPKEATQKNCECTEGGAV